MKRSLRMRSGSGGKALPVVAAALMLLAPTVARPSETATGSMPPPLVSFEGVGNDEQQAAHGARTVPPDTVGDVGPNHYVQAVQHSIAVFAKDGTRLRGPFQPNTLWSDGACSTGNRGDPIVLYDQLADRWLFGMFAYVDRTEGPFFQCLAVSRTPDPTGDWHVYEIEMPRRAGLPLFNDYPKLAVWPDAYLMTVMQQDPAARELVGSAVFAFDRQRLLDGSAPRWVFLDRPDLYSLLPADLDGHRLPPPGTPAVLAQLVDEPDRIQLWTFHYDFDAGTAELSGPAVLATAPFDPELCSATFNLCIPQPGGPTLDALSDRLMFRAAYRNLGGREVLLLNHTVDVDGSDHAGIRWYEIHDPAGPAPAIAQQGTFAPDEHHRWMGSIAMDASGNVALGYSVSSATLFPSIRYAGRLASDPPGALAQDEVTLVDGAGSQLTNARRWGDYSAMTVDPADECTFWYTSEYYPATSSSGWRTRIGSFRFPSCGAPANVVQPSIDGNARVGETLRAGDGGWSGHPEPELSRAWLRCDASGSDCLAIEGATGETYTVEERDTGAALAVRVTAANGLGSATADSAPTDAVPDEAPPLATARRLSEPNAHGWYRTPVTIQLGGDDGPFGSGVRELRFQLAGAETGSGVLPGASGEIVVDAEGATTLTYFAVDQAGNSGVSQTLDVRIDETPPTLTCRADPSILWPPNRKLVPVLVTVELDDSLSGPDAFRLLSTTSSEPENTRLGPDIVGLEIGAADVAGWLRAERSGRAGDRTYALAYRGSDLAGNVGECRAVVKVPLPARRPVPAR